VTKANLPLLSQAALGVLAGGFIGLGAMFFTLVVSDPGLGFSTARVLGGVAFSLGLILVVVAGAEPRSGAMFILPSRKRNCGERLMNDCHSSLWNVASTRF